MRVDTPWCVRQLVTGGGGTVWQMARISAGRSHSLIFVRIRDRRNRCFLVGFASNSGQFGAIIGGIWSESALVFARTACLSLSESRGDVYRCSVGYATCAAARPICAAYWPRPILTPASEALAPQRERHTNREVSQQAALARAVCKQERTPAADGREFSCCWPLFFVLMSFSYGGQRSCRRIKSH